jgi:hypothetical protein
MANLFEQVLAELDEIVFSEYGRNHTLSLLEADNDDDDVISTPFSRAASFPARALRYKKAKSVMNKYAKKILSKIDKIIDRFETEIDKSIPQITAKGKDLQAQLNAAKSSGDEVEAKSVVNQQKKFTEEVKQNQEQRVANLNQTIENLINTYTTAIHKRIDEPGYVLKVEISDKGKADLKFMWDELVSAVKQKSYEKLVKIINNKNIKGLESLVSRLEVEIEKAEDERRRFRSSSRSNRSPEEGGSAQDKPGKDPSKDPDKESEYTKLKKYLDDELPEGILEEDEPYKYAVKGGQLYDLYFEIDDNEEKITAVFYEDGANIDDEDPVKEHEIKDATEIDDIVDRIQKGSEAEEDVQKEKRIEKYESTLFDHLDTLFRTREKLIKDVFSSTFYNDYSNAKDLKRFVKYMVGKIMDRPADYQKQEKIMNTGSLSDRQMVNLFLKKFYQSYNKDKGTSNESFMSLSEYKKLNS